MMYSFKLKSLIIGTIFTIFANLASAQSGAEILQQVDNYRAPAMNFSFDVGLSDSQGNNIDFEVFVRDYSKGLVRYVAPNRYNGRSILYLGNQMWAYVPGSQRELRISPQQQLLGGVSSADIARIVYSMDYVVSDVKPIESGKKILMLDNNGGAYQRIQMTVDANNRPLVAEFYAANDRKLKTLQFENYQNVLSNTRPMTLRVIDHMNGNSQAIMKISNMSMDSAPAAWYQPGALPNLQ